MNKKGFITTIGAILSMSITAQVFSSPLLTAGIFSTSAKYPYTNNLLIAKSDALGNWNRITALPSSFDTSNSNVRGLTCANTNCIAIVTQETSSHVTNSSIIISQDQGDTWQLNNNVSNLPEHGDMVFDSIECTNKRCNIAGVYDDGLNVHSFVLNSQDAGLNWNFRSIETPNTHMISNYYLSCNTKNCMAAGTETINKNATVPAIFVSQNHTWHAVTDIMNAPTNLVIPQVAGTGCTENHCNAIAVDMYGDNPLPLIISSTDQLDKWSYVTTVANFPATYSALHAISCDKTICIAVGSYDIGHQSTPMILRSDSSGNWSLIKTPIIYGGIFSAVNCNNNTCAAMGNSNDQPLVYISHNQGKNWINAPITFDKEMTAFHIESIQINQNTIIAAGFYEDNHKNTQAMLMTSTDNGKTWNITNNINGLPTSTVRSMLMFSN